MKKTIRLSGIAYESLVNGPGIRRVFFSQGCKHNCKGCFNPDTHDFNAGEEKDMEELIKDTLSNPIIKGVTFSGGDPFERAVEFSYMAKSFKEKNLNIWCYTGYTFEEILENIDKRKGFKELLNSIDVLVDGRFIEEEKANNIKYRGSKNQRIIDVQKSLKENRIVRIEDKYDEK
ncbi:anaerobic ribonucleoside-triphosphate reductase activating protein [Clostridium isatidis]|uniref:Anaerobic ribonucleoside-triphosphate reductase-activating protein n=1 Tax=Clostridium isatidis TaxID=182773 RepID=A0A343J933_9CLOT|nr:anaerobic ribonucleoside-triphosphate reductase activating protein [Clostridium isatidis]ASW42041.1 anaerobic ribonucleoside-triphosphate reductase activating protein [Clostridium isatidis]NLZ35759.1 anaerobic ribonucleoside-triphosphate reductase activating protein [Clostridiales bacterium]